MESDSQIIGQTFATGDLSIGSGRTEEAEARSVRCMKITSSVEVKYRLAIVAACLVVEIKCIWCGISSLYDGIVYLLDEAVGAAANIAAAASIGFNRSLTTKNMIDLLRLRNLASNQSHYHSL